MQEKTAGIGEAILNKLLETGLASQLEGSEELNVAVNSDLLKLLTGKADSIRLTGEQLVTHQDMHVSHLDVQVNRLAIDLLSAINGKVELAESADVIVKVMLTEADLYQTMNAESVRKQLQHVPLPVDDKVLPLSVQHVVPHLPGDGKFVLKINALAHRSEGAQPIEMEMVLRILEGGKIVIFESSQFPSPKDKALLFRETSALAMKMSEFIQLRDFQFSDLSLQIQRMEAEADQLSLWLRADIQRIPELENVS